MPRPLTPLPKNTERHMRALLQGATSTWETRRIQCVLMRVSLGMSSQDIAPLVGLHPDSVKHIWKRYLDEGDEALVGEQRGQARGNAYLTLDEEKDILASLLKRAERGQLITVRHVHAALCENVGKNVDPSTTYRLLQRHGWRKIVPLPEHPKGNRRHRKNFREAFSPTGEKSSYGSHKARTQTQSHV